VQGHRQAAAFRAPNNTRDARDSPILPNIPTHWRQNCQSFGSALKVSGSRVIAFGQVIIQTAAACFDHFLNTVTVRSMLERQGGAACAYGFIQLFKEYVVGVQALHAQRASAEPGRG
jgi:hypothetical protein